MNFCVVYDCQSKHSVANFAELKKTLLSEVVATVTLEDIAGKLILNLDQTGIKICTMFFLDK